MRRHSEGVFEDRTQLTELSSGVDALYMSGRAAISEDYIERLRALRVEAEEAGGGVPLIVGGVEFQLMPRSFGKYRYCIVHPYGQIGFTSSQKMPAIRIQPRAEFLHGAGPGGTVDWFREVLEIEFGAVLLTVSRIDLHADVQGWELTGDHRNRFVCRAVHLATYEASAEFNGFQFGKRGSGTICARIYDKSTEILKTGSAYWPEIWGPAYDDQTPVIRVEFEIGRDSLRQYGLNTPEEVLASVGALWVNLTGTWLSYRAPTSDQTRSRWPVASEWSQVTRSQIADGAHGIERMYEGKCRGELEKMAPYLVGYLTNVAALTKTDSFEVSLPNLRRLVKWYAEVSGVTFEQRAAKKRREYALL